MDNLIPSSVLQDTYCIDKVTRLTVSGTTLSILTSSASTFSTKSLKAGRRLRRTMASLCSEVRPLTLGSDVPVRTISLPRRKCWNSESYEGSLKRRPKKKIVIYK